MIKWFLSLSFQYYFLIPLINPLASTPFSRHWLVTPFPSPSLLLYPTLGLPFICSIIVLSSILFSNMPPLINNNIILFVSILYTIKEYQQKMERCSMVREVLKSHIAALPNLATPSSEGLAPLPSAGDLFS